MRTYESPVVTKEDEGTAHERLVERHPSYALIGASRVHGKTRLYGSDFVHNGFITIRIGPSELHRHLSNDWHHGSAQQYIEVDLSEAQWATFISTLNMGQGVPCTLTRKDMDSIPGIADPQQDRRQQFTGEMTETFGDALHAMRKVIAAVENSNLSNVKQKEIIGHATKAIQEIMKNTGFVAEQFGEHIENTVEKAKIEVSAYMTGAIARAGLKALSGEPPLDLTVKELPPADHDDIMDALLKYEAPNEEA